MSLWEQPTPLPKLNYFSCYFCVLNLSTTGDCLDIADTEVCCFSQDAWDEAGWLAVIGRGPSCLLSRFPCPRSMQASFGQGWWRAEGLRHRYSTCAAPTLRLPVFLSTGNPLQDNLWETMGSLLHWWNLGCFWGFSGRRANRKFTKGYLVWHWACPGHRGAPGSPAIDLGEGSCILRKSHQGTVLVIWLIRLHTTTAGVACSIPIQGIKILHAVQYGQKINEERKLDKTYPAGKRWLPKIKSESRLHMSRNGV